jgi:hypothetical protein
MESPAGKRVPRARPQAAISRRGSARIARRSKDRAIARKRNPEDSRTAPAWVETRAPPLRASWEKADRPGWWHCGLVPSAHFAWIARDSFPPGPIPPLARMAVKQPKAISLPYQFQYIFSRGPAKWPQRSWHSLNQVLSCNRSLTVAAQFGEGKLLGGAQGADGDGHRSWRTAVEPLQQLLGALAQFAG